MSTSSGDDLRVGTEQEDLVVEGKRKGAWRKLKVLIPTAARYYIVNGNAGIIFSTVFWGILPEKTGKVVLMTVGFVMGVGFFVHQQFHWPI